MAKVASMYRAGRLPRHGQRHRSLPRPDPRRPRPRRGSSGRHAPAGAPTATPSSTRSRRSQPDAVIWDTTQARQARPPRARPDVLRRVRRRGCVHREQQGHDASASSTTSSGAGSLPSVRSGIPETHDVLLCEDPDRWLVIGPDRAANPFSKSSCHHRGGDEVSIHTSESTFWGWRSVRA